MKLINYFWHALLAIVITLFVITTQSALAATPAEKVATEQQILDSLNTILASSFPKVIEDTISAIDKN